MNLLAIRVLEFQGDDELAGQQQQQAVEPTLYDDGTAEIMVKLTKNRTVYVRVNIADLVRMRCEAGKVEEAPEQ